MPGARYQALQIRERHVATRPAIDTEKYFARLDGTLAVCRPLVRYVPYHREARLVVRLLLEKEADAFVAHVARRRSGCVRACGRACVRACEREVAIMFTISRGACSHGAGNFLIAGNVSSVR